MGSTQRWVRLGYEDAIEMGGDRYAHMVYNCLKTRTSHKPKTINKADGIKMILMPGWTRISQAALARELKISRQTLLHTLRFLEVKGIIGYKPDERGTTIWFKNFTYHSDTPSKQGCPPREHYNRSSLDHSLKPKTISVATPVRGEISGWVMGVRQTQQYLRSQEKAAECIPVELLARIREIQGRAQHV